MRVLLTGAAGFIGAGRHELCGAARYWLVVRQGGFTFGERLVDGHRQAYRLAGGPVVRSAFAQAWFTLSATALDLTGSRQEEGA